MNQTSPAIGSRLSSLGWRAALLILIWAMLAGDWPWENGLLALALVAAALFSSCHLCPPAPIGLRPWQVVRFLPWFLGQSLVGGIDVAQRALNPRMPLDSGFIVMPFQAPPGPPRIALIWIMSLLPGTAAVHWRDSDISVHVLDRKLHTVEKLQELERRVTALFTSP
jgi:multicomponent Na+:H+ antiporter subunit E